MINDLTKLFQLDPLELTDDNIDEIIRTYREARGKFLQGNKSAALPKNTGTAKKMSLDELLG
jgi:hypothetical protein